MDNLSHSLAGLVAGELIHRSLPAETDLPTDRLRRRLILLTCWLASNFPDLDLVLTPLLPAPLGYLLHHRGHTHTVLYLLPQALLLSGAIWLFWPAARRMLRQHGNARKGIGLALLAGFGLHLAMDYLNSYGIHPFHPVDSRWFYGDMVFILEPWFWVVFGAPLAIMLPRPWLRSVLMLVLIAVPGYFTARAYLAWPAFAALAIIAAALGMLQHYSGVRGRAALSGAAVLALMFIAVQATMSGNANRLVQQQLAARDPASRVLDVALSPFPANPVCWAFASFETNENAASYRVRRGMLSLAPSWMPVTACPASLADLAAQRDVTPAIAYFFEETGNLQRLRELERANCHFRAWLRFARIPLVTDAGAADMRFSSSPRGNFTTMAFADVDRHPCPEQVPGWKFPRAELFKQRGGQ